MFKRVRELADVAYAKGILRHTAFLSDREQEIAKASLSGVLGDFEFFGGYDNAERKLAIFNADKSSFANIVECIFVQQDFAKMNDITLTHRDFLGAFLSLGLKRETLGDILICKDNGAAVFATNSAATLLCTELTTVGRANVSVYKTSFEMLDLETAPVQAQKATLASLRLDVALSAMLKISRGMAQKLVTTKCVSVNHIDIIQTHYEIQENDIFTIKGYGKYKLSEVGGKSRKDRIFINYIKY